MSDAALENAGDAEGRPSPWDRIVEVVGPLTPGQRWTAALAFGATALFLTAGMPTARTLTDDSVRGSLDSASAPAVTGSLEAPEPSQFSTDLDSGVTTDASTFFNDPTLSGGSEETFVDPLAGMETDDGTGIDEGSTDEGSTEDTPPPSDEGDGGSQPPITTPIPLPVPLPAL